MSHIEVRGVTTVFGRHPKRVMPLVREGLGKAELLARTGHTLALRDVSLSVEQGEIFVVMGLSGSGKSTLIRHLNRLIDPTEGSIAIDGVDILGLGIPDLVRFRRGKIGMVFQHFALLPHRTVIGNVAYGLEIQGVRRREREARAAEWIAAVGLTGVERQYPSQLSGGMRQRVGLARALCADAEILLMDEPFSALDPLIRSQMQDLLLQLQGRLRKTIVFITHDLDEALRLGDHIAILKDGQIVQAGEPVDILLRPADDYVRSFVKDVNRARILTVEAVMRPPPLRLTDETLEEALFAMQRRGAEIGYVVRPDGYKGVVTREAVSEAMARESSPTAVSEIAVELAPVREGDTLAAALPATLASEFPVPVVDAEGALKGVLTPGEVGEALGPSAEPAPPAELPPAVIAGSSRPADAAPAG